MARIWRKGQKKVVRIYRFLSTGMIDEKIYQRQLSKLGMNSSIFEDFSSNSDISAQDLRDIFSLDTSSDCLTHQLSDCSCLSSNEDFNDWIHLRLSNIDAFDKWSNIDNALQEDFYKSICKLVTFAYIRSV